MTRPGVSCKAVALQNSFEWPCSMCPFPQLRLVGVRTSYIYFSNISWTPWVLDPITNPFLGPSSWLHPVSKVDHQLIPYTKINSRWIKDLNISHDTIKIIEDSSRKISDIPCCNIFANIAPWARDIKERINKQDYIKQKIIGMAKKKSAKWKGNQQYGKIYLPMIPWTRVWFPKYIKNSYDTTLGRQMTQLKNGQRTWINTSPRT